MNFICLWSFKWSHLIVDPIKYNKLLKIHPSTEDWFIHVVWWIIKDSEWKIYLHHNAKLNEFMLPWGKVEEWESFEDAIKRELKEELNIDILDFHKISSVKYISWCKWCFHTFVVDTYTWTPINNDSDKYDYYWAEILSSENKIGFSVKIDWTVTDDVQDIMHSFLDLYHLYYISSRIDINVLLESQYKKYEELQIKFSNHYYLYLDPVQKIYFFENV